MNTLPSTLASAGACSDKPVPLWQPFVPTFSDADFNQAVDLFDLAVTPASVSSLHNSTGQASVLSCYPSQQNGPGALQPGTTAAPASESGHNADSQSVMGEVTTQPAVTASRHTDDPKVLKNREAQRRFKQKQKVALVRCCSSPFLDIIPFLNLPILLANRHAPLRLKHSLLKPMLGCNSCKNRRRSLKHEICCLKRCPTWA